MLAAYELCQLIHTFHFHALPQHANLARHQRKQAFREHYPHRMFTLMRLAMMTFRYRQFLPVY